MRKIIQAGRRGTVLSLVTAVAVGGAASPALAFKSSSNKSLLGDVNTISAALNLAIKSIDKTTNGLTASIKTLTTGLAATNAALATTNTNLAATTAAQSTTAGQVTGLTAAFASGSTAVNTALGEVNTALSDPNTGLAALNVARPRFAVLDVVSNAFSVVGSTPEHAVTIYFQAANEAILDFGEDVSERALVTTTAPGAASIAQAVDCANVPGGGCGGTDANADHVLVTTEDFAPSLSETPEPVTV